nr:MAG TPA: hypothetical protein [Caudoviricetes sp.]
MLPRSTNASMPVTATGHARRFGGGLEMVVVTAA